MTDPKLTDTRLTEIARLDDLERTGLDEVSVMATELIHLRAEVAAIARAAGGDRGSDERISEYITRLQDRAAVAEGNYAELQALELRAAKLAHSARVTDDLGCSGYADADYWVGKHPR